MEKIFQRLNERFGRIDGWTVNSNGTAENVPPFLKLILAILDSRGGQPLVLVLPRRGEMPRLAATIHGLARLARTADALLAESRMKLKQGDTVCINPSKHVFIFDGEHTGRPGSFWLRELNLSADPHKYAALELPMSAMLRLEPTMRQRPAGKITQAMVLREPPIAALDRLLGTHTFGNQARVKNEVLLLDSRSGLQEFAAHHVICPRGQNGFPVLTKLVPFGSIRLPLRPDDGWFQKWDDRVTEGEPLVAVTSDAETLHNCCLEALPHSQLVMANGVETLARNLQAFDCIAQRQRLVLFADTTETEALKTLCDRGCKAWWLGSRELFFGAAEHCRTTGPVGRLLTWARNDGGLEFMEHKCVCESLEQAAQWLEQLYGQQSQGSESFTVKSLGRIWRLLNDTASICGPVAKSELADLHRRLHELKQEVELNRTWLSPDTRSALEEASRYIGVFLDDESGRFTTKGTTLSDLLQKANETGQRNAVVVRGAFLDSARALVATVESNAQVFSPQTFPADADFDEVILASWLGAETVRDLVGRLSARKFLLLSYPFESRWFLQTWRRIRRRPDISTLTSRELAAIVCGSADGTFMWPDDEQPHEAELRPETGDVFDVGQFERRLSAVRKGRPTDAADPTVLIPARYMGFVGDAYAYVTATHKLPVATQLTASTSRLPQALPERIPSELHKGDLVVFPESGERELIQELADRLLGSEAALLRRAALMWKLAMRYWKEGCSTNVNHLARFAEECRQRGHQRHPVTIRNWFAETSQIGPQTLDDLMVIASVTGNKSLEDQVETVWQAIERLRGAHLSAGMRLRNVLLQKLPEVFTKVAENGTKVDLGELGSAWVVEVEDISGVEEDRTRGEVNRLLRD